jgi:hypothetical protein
MKRNEYKILVKKSVGKKPLGRSRCRWEDNMRINLKRRRVGCWGLDLSGLGHGPVADSCEHGNEPSGFIQGVELLV